MMNRRLQFTTLALAVFMMLGAAGCSKTEVPDTAVSVSETAEVTVQSEEAKDTAVETSEAESESSAEEVSSIPTEDELVKAYADFLNTLAKDNELSDELVFTVADINSDGVSELLYAESSVNAAGVYVCFYNNGNIVPVGPFGCNGGMKYAPKENRIISIVNNMDYIDYEIDEIDADYKIKTYEKFAISPDSEEEYVYHYSHNEKEVTHDEYAGAFAAVKTMDVRAVDYTDMYMYGWCNTSNDPIDKRIKTMFGEEVGRKCNMIIPIDEMSKLIGTWNIYSSETEGEICYADEDDIQGKVIIHDDYTVDIYRFDDEIWYKNMRMNFVNGSFSDYAENTDWYVWLDGDDMGNDTFNMNLTPDGKLCLNYINEYDYEYPVANWKIYSKGL